ncbi:MAG: hypothetical protein CW342_12265 [Thermoactinomycetaceae bacterium]|nr:hypothetical protein [Bacillota bacterium]MBO2533633.1 hypothetical protein [Thermoactinomycetaceae bacterium]
MFRKFRLLGNPPGEFGGARHEETLPRPRPELESEGSGRTRSSARFPFRGPGGRTDRPLRPPDCKAPSPGVTSGDATEDSAKSADVE